MPQLVYFRILLCYNVISKLKGLITMIETGEGSAKRGAKVKVLDSSVAEHIIGRIIAVLRVFIAETVARRIIGMVLLSVGVADVKVVELTGMRDRSVRDLRKKLRDGADDKELFGVSGNGGRKRKLMEIESLVADNIESNDYHTQQEIADMISKEHDIRVHRSTVSRMLKKNASDV